jgi:hypothetical protein
VRYFAPPQQIQQKTPRDAPQAPQVISAIGLMPSEEKANPTTRAGSMYHSTLYE